MTTTLEEFESRLRALMGDPTHLRPFVCEGSPLDCKIFIVGINPATPLNESWWEDWKPGYGFLKAQWQKEYERQRGGTTSRTRRRIKLVVEASRPEKCVETNIYSTPTAHVRDLKNRDRDTRIFDFLLSAIQPKALLLHGPAAVNHIESIADATLGDDIWTEVNIGHVPVSVFAASPMYLWSYEKAKQVGAVLRSACGQH